MWKYYNTGSIRDGLGYMVFIEFTLLLELLLFGFVFMEFIICTLLPEL